MDWLFISCMCLVTLSMASGETYLIKWHVKNTLLGESDNAFYARFIGTEGTQGPVVLNPEGSMMAKGMYVKTEGRVGTIRTLETWKDPDDGMYMTTIEAIDAHYSPRRWSWSCNCWYDNSWGRTNDKTYNYHGPAYTFIESKFGRSLKSARLTTNIISSRSFRLCRSVTCSLHCARTPACTAFNLGKKEDGSCVCDTINVETPLPPALQGGIESNPNFEYHEQKRVQN